MNLSRILVLCLITLLSVAPLRGQFLYWQYNNILDESREGGAQPDMAMDAAGNLHIVFWHQEFDRLLYGQRDASTGNWIFEYVDSTGISGWASSIALDASGSPVVAYFESVSGLNQLKLSRRTGPGAWIKENLPGHPSRGHWGSYGPTDMMNVNNRVNPSIDLVITSAGKTHVLFQDLYLAPGSFPACSFSSSYGLKMWQAHQDAGGLWHLENYGQINDRNLSCGGSSGSDYPMPFGDWYGRDVQALETPGGGLAAVTTSRFNSQVLLFQTTTADTLWDTLRVDSITTAVGGGWGSPEYQLNRFFTWEHTVADFSGDGTLHLSYSSSMNHGDNFCCLVFNTLFYTQLLPGDSVFQRHKIFDNRYVTHGQIAAPSADSIFISYSDHSSNQTMIAMSVDSGASWLFDTVYHRSPVHRTPLLIRNGILHVLIYDWDIERLVLATRPVAGPSSVWDYEVVRESAFNGASLDAAVNQTPTDTTFYLAYNEEFSGSLNFKEGLKSGSSWSWTTTVPDTNCTHCGTVNTLLGNAGEKIVTYNAGVPNDLRLAINTGSGWAIDTVMAGADPGYLSTAMGSDDTLHMAYYSNATHWLHHTWGKPGGPWLTEVVDSTNEHVGEYCSIRLDASNQPRISYHNDSLLCLMYAEKNAGVWDTTMVYVNKPSSVGKFTSLALQPDGQPSIAFLDEQNQKVWLAERDPSLNWNFSLVDSAALFSIGRPTQLVIDRFGNPWVAYNYRSSFDKVKLMHRDTIWREVTVSTTGYIANSFRFLISRDDLYLAGTKSAIGNTGLAMITAPRGVFVGTEDAAIGAVDVTIFPNPNAGQFDVSLKLDKPTHAGLQLVNLMGQTVREVTPPSPMAQGEHLLHCDAGSLPAGIYLLMLVGETTQAAGKVVITTR